mgnify:CR=1 FL=1
MSEECGSEIIECWSCGCNLNGKSLWIVTDADDSVNLCEECYANKNKQIKTN